MIDRPVVLVLGAGASKPYGFPLGQDLVDDVIGGRSTTSDQVVESLLNLRSTAILDAFYRNLAKSLRSSVDAFLESRPEYLAVGKAIIAYQLVQHEEDVNLFTQRGQQRDHHPQEPKEDWYRYLFEIMLSDGFDAFSKNRLSVITYNYDRSFEYCLYHALQSGYGKPLGECALKVKGIPIIHLHGKLGELPELDSGNGRPYRNNRDNPDCLRLAMKGIRIVSEPIKDNPEDFARAHLVLKEAETVIFLGFGYLEENVKRLQLGENHNPKTRFHGTGVGLYPAERAPVIRLFPAEMKYIPPIDIDDQWPNVREYLRHNRNLLTSQ